MTEWVAGWSASLEFKRPKHTQPSMIRKGSFLKQNLNLHCIVGVALNTPIMSQSKNVVLGPQLETALPVHDSHTTHQTYHDTTVHWEHFMKLHLCVLSFDGAGLGGAVGLAGGSR